MQETIYMRVHNLLSWKRIIAFNIIIFLLLAVPLSVRLAQERQENRSSATNETLVSPPPPPPAYPTKPPTIERVTMFYGKAGDTVVVLGQNFGAYQWGSTLTLGNMLAQKDDIVRWSDKVIEALIPQGAQTGKVWVAVNNHRATWEGSLLLYDLERDAKIGLEPAGNTETNLWIDKGSEIVSGRIEISSAGGSVSVDALGLVSIESVTPTQDSLGQKHLIEFRAQSPLPRSKTPIIRMRLDRPSRVEILRAELFDAGQQMRGSFSDPLAVKFQP